MKDINYNLLPEHIAAGAQRYIERGEDVGDFLRAVICNDLKESFGRADAVNRARMFEIVSFFYNEAPGSCWGSPQAMTKWMQHQGMQGLGYSPAGERLRL